MRAHCENCGQPITADDFKAGRYFLFWITPTLPPESLYLCQDCRNLEWEERERLFQAWRARRESERASHRHSPRKKRRSRMTLL